MSTPKPSARNSARKPEAAEEVPFSFEHDGETYTFEKSFAIIRRPGWLRQNRRRDQLDLTFTILEAVAGDEALDVIDGMDEDEFEALSRQMEKALGASFSA